MENLSKHGDSSLGDNIMNINSRYSFGPSSYFSTPGVPFSSSPDLILNAGDALDCMTDTTISISGPAQSFDTQCLRDASYYDSGDDYDDGGWADEGYDDWGSGGDWGDGGC